MDADSQARQLLDRMAVDFAQMVKRSDVDYYLKSSWFASGSPPAPSGVTGVRTLLQPGNDTIAFYSTVPGYYPSPVLKARSRSLPIGSTRLPLRLTPPTSDSSEWEKDCCGTASPTPKSAPVVFMPIPLASPIPIAELPNPTPSPSCNSRLARDCQHTSSWSDSEVIGPQVFRFEYYYLLKGQTNPSDRASS